MYLSLAYFIHIYLFFLFFFYQSPSEILIVITSPRTTPNGKWLVFILQLWAKHTQHRLLRPLPSSAVKKKKEATDQVFMSCKQTCYERAFSGHLALRECWITLPVSCSFRKRQGLTPGYQAAPLSYLHCGVQAPLGGFSPAGQLEASCPTLMGCFIMQSRLFFLLYEVHDFTSSLIS